MTQTWIINVDCFCRLLLLRRQRASKIFVNKHRKVTEYAEKTVEKAQILSLQKKILYIRRSQQQAPQSSQQQFLRIILEPNAVEPFEFVFEQVMVKLLVAFILVTCIVEIQC